MPPGDLLQQLQRTLGDGYRVERELARGGMSRVYLATDKGLGREVVVKALSPDLAAEVNFERFSREIRLAGRLQNPHIVPLLSAGDAEGTPYYVMPFVEGESLRHLLQASGELPVDQAIRIMRDVAVALDYAHRQGVVHRDIKPENILLSGGTGVVTDFGVAKAISASTAADGSTNLTTAGMALGTPAYMAPEQASADPSTDHRADIYAWGVVAYEMLTGAAPFAGRPTQAVIAAHIAEPVPPIHRAAVPERLARLVMRTLSKRPAERPQSARDIVLELDALTSTGLTPAGTVAAHGSRRGIPLWVWPAAAAALVAFALFAMNARRQPMSASSEASVKRIAVLPFANASGSKDEEYFADGMSEELAAVLGRVRGVQVASYSSSFAFKGKSIDVKEVGRKLDVDAVLEARVRRDGRRLRVTAQLTDVGNGLSLWSDSYEKDAKDVFSVQDEIVHAIAGALELRFAATSTQAAPRDVQGTTDPNAYDLYLRGRYYWHKRGAASLRKAIDLFTAAGARDPKFGRAFAGLASSQVLLTEYADDAPRETDDRALAAADRALALDPGAAEAYLARGLVDVHRWKWEEARQSYVKAIALDSANATAHQWLGELYYALGEGDSSVAQMRMAKALDPLAPIPAGALAYALYCSRQYQESLREAQLAMDLAPDLAIIARVAARPFFMIGDTARALREVRRMRDLEPNQARGLADFVYLTGHTGHRDEALATLKHLETLHATALPMVVAYIGVGNTKSALQALDQAIATRDQSLSQYPLMDPMFDAIRSTPEFRAAAHAAGTPKVLETTK
jgi:TolB-like protein/tetratricopeptide (TPR) repeat protein/tRNA A-37 threonylcarbamoyl transferase component Bud32